MGHKVHDVADVELHVLEIVRWRRRQHPGVDRVHLQHRKFKRLPGAEAGVVILSIRHTQHVGRHRGGDAVDFL